MANRHTTLRLAATAVAAAAIWYGAPAVAITVCGNNICESGIPIETNLTCPQDCPAEGDFDGDGILDNSDNCPFHANHDQANCDLDDLGDVCDSRDGSFVLVAEEVSCLVDEDDHLPWSLWYDLEWWVEDHYVDESDCHSPDLWVQRLKDEATCYNVNPYPCCIGLLGESQLCAYINTDFCHR